MTLGKPKYIGHYGAVDVGDRGAKESNSSSSSSRNNKRFIIPTNLKLGNYILYQFL
jgi:hypothetical protein